MTSSEPVLWYGSIVLAIIGICAFLLIRSDRLERKTQARPATVR